MRASTGGPRNSEGGAPRQDVPADLAAAAKPLAPSSSIVGVIDDAAEERRAAAEAFHAHDHGTGCPTPCPIVERHLAAYWAQWSRPTVAQPTSLLVEDVAQAERLAYGEEYMRALTRALHGPGYDRWPVDVSWFLSPLLDDTGKPRRDKAKRLIYPEVYGFRVLDEMDDEVRAALLLQDAEAQGVDGFRVGLTVGLDDDLDPDEEEGAAIVARRRAAARELCGWEQRTKPLAPCFDERDLRVDMGGASLNRGDAGKLPTLSAHLSARHGDHGYWASPFCRGCWGRPLAEARLQRWLLLNPGKTPQEEIPEEIPGDVPEIDDEVDVADAYLDLDALLDMPEPVMLVEGLVPQGAYGLITGRDGTGKSFLALDLALHVATLRPWYGARPVDVANYGRALYLVGEGAQSFGKRVQAWLDEHDDARRPHAGDLVFRNGTVDLFGGGEAFDALLRHVVAAEPDLIVVDTLARSSGAADANAARDMSIVRERIDMLRRASNGGTVLVVAHTTKGDTDARGSSVIEDDADFVLKVDLRDNGSTQVVKVAKQKDGPSGHSITLAMASREVGDRTTLVLREAGKGAEPLNSEDATTEQKVVGVLFAARSLDPLTAAQVISASGATRSLVYTVLSRLVDAGTVEKHEKAGRGATYSLARSAWPKDVQ